MMPSLKTLFAATMFVATSLAACSDNPTNTATNNNISTVPNAFCEFDETERTAKIFHISQFGKEILLMTIDNFQFSTNGTYVSGKKNITVVEDVAGLNKDVLSHVTIDKKANGKSYCTLTTSASTGIIVIRNDAVYQMKEHSQQMAPQNTPAPGL